MARKQKSLGPIDATSSTEAQATRRGTLCFRPPICRAQKRAKQSARPRHTEGSSKQERQRSRLCQRRQAVPINHYPVRDQFAPAPSLYQILCRAIHSLCHRYPTHRDRSLGLLEYDEIDQFSTSHGRSCKAQSVQLRRSPSGITSAAAETLAQDVTARFWPEPYGIDLKRK